jgi:hypothetical protein
MKIDITAIKFNHTPGLIDTGALMIRENFTRNITVPEWTPATDGSDAKAAYSIKNIQGNVITVQAMITCDTPGTTVKIKTNGGGTFGDVAEKEVAITDSYISFSLTNTALTSIDILDVSWQWQYQLGKGAWEDFRITSFRIYTVLSLPRSPWSTSTNFDDTQLPWTDVLDVTNNWAKGATTTLHIQEMITSEVYALGETPTPVIKYDTTNGATNYAYPDFQCTEFLNRLKGQYGLGSKVNCSDCATIVSSFTNILGCELWQSIMGSDFALRSLRAIGTKTWAVPFNGKFAYHEVAWVGACDENTNLYDACLELNTNRSVGAPTPLLPVNMLFGLCSNQTDYRTYLTTSGAAGCDSCVPIPGGKERRTVS